MKSTLEFIWRTSSKQLFIILFLVLLVVLITFLTNGFSMYAIGTLDTWFGKWLDPISAISTFLVAMVVWYNAKAEERINSLDEYLNVHFKIGDRYVMSCYYARISGEADIRGFGQQVGSQISETDRLGLFPGIQNKRTEVKNFESGDSIKLHEVEMQLKTIPNTLRDEYRYWIFYGPSKVEQNTLKYDKEHAESDSPDQILDRWQQINLVEGANAAHPETPINPNIEDYF